MRIQLAVISLILFQSIVLHNENYMSYYRPYDISMARVLLVEAKDDLDYLSGLSNSRELTREFARDLDISKQRYRTLEEKGKSLRQKPDNEKDVRRFISEITPLAKHVAAQRFALESDLTSNGTTDVVIYCKWQNKLVSGWRVGLIGENDVPPDAQANMRGYVENLCKSGIKRRTLVIGEKTDSTVTLKRVVVGSVYLWIRHPRRCEPLTDPFPTDLPKPDGVDLDTPEETPPS